jgi:ABC-type spermidine/putrescine transport system permease subunit II
VLAAGAILVAALRARAARRGPVGRPAARRRGRRRTCRRRAAARPGDALLGGYSALVYVLLFAPILIVIVYAFNAGRQVEVWEGLSAKWFGEALADEEIRSAIGRSLQIAVASGLVATALGTATALALLQGPLAHAGVVRHRAVPRARRPELVLAIAALIFFVNAGFELGELTMFLGTRSSTPRS